MQTEFARAQMITQQIRAWDVLDERVLDAMRRTPREFFVPERYAELAFADTDIPLRAGQHMLAPKIVGRLLQALDACRECARWWSAPGPVSCLPAFRPWAPACAPSKFTPSSRRRAQPKARRIRTGGRRHG